MWRPDVGECAGRRRGPPAQFPHLTARDAVLTVGSSTSDEGGRGGGHGYPPSRSTGRIAGVCTAGSAGAATLSGGKVVVRVRVVDQHGGPMHPATALACVGDPLPDRCVRRVAAPTDTEGRATLRLVPDVRDTVGSFVSDPDPPRVCPGFPYFG